MFEFSYGKKMCFATPCYAYITFSLLLPTDYSTLMAMALEKGSKSRNY